MQRSSVRIPFREPTLAEILASPITRAVMAADGVDPHDVEAMVRRIAHMRRGATEEAGPGQEAGPATSHGIESGA